MIYDRDWSRSCVYANQKVEISAALAGPAVWLGHDHSMSTPLTRGLIFNLATTEILLQDKKVMAELCLTRQIIVVACLTALYPPRH